jgi:uncharacterized protein YbaP (TraB family)
MKKILFALSTLFYFSANAQYNSLLWKISGNGLKEPSYLYGTMHTSDPRVFEVGDNASKYVLSSDAYAMELDPKEAFNLSMLGKMMMGKGYSLKKMIPEREYNLLDSIVKSEIGYSVTLFDNVAPVFTMTIFEASAMELKGNDGDAKRDVLDLYFYKQAKKKKKKIIGIETVDEQLGALNALSYQEQADLLVKEINEFEKNKNEGTDLVKFYLEQNLDSLASNDVDMQMPEKFYKALVTDRNVRMADRIDVFIKEQPTFIAVGALHLPSEKGVIELLRKKGYKVEPERK